MKTRIEKDSLGKIKVPADAYYGAQTQRAVNNFPVSGRCIHQEFVRSYAQIKIAAATANERLKLLDGKKSRAITRAAAELASGKLLDNFVVDIYQAGAGTSTNMNVNEVIANRANEILGGKKGIYNFVHPNDHVNMSQSTNDTFHTCIHLSSVRLVQSKLLPSLTVLEKTLTKKSRQFSRLVKVGRTHLQDAVPITLGQEFSGYAASVRDCRRLVEYASRSMLRLPLGGTAVGTGINTDKKYSEFAIKKLSSITRVKFRKSGNFFNETQNQNEETELSSALKSLAVALNKISNDFILLSSGPNAGLFEINLPPVQPGSSIMAGKVNPSMAEMMNMVCFQVIGNDLAVTEAARSGQLELNVYMPVIAHNLLDSIEILSNAIEVFTKKCVSGITANRKKIDDYVKKNSIIATALIPHIGYTKTAEIVKKAYRENKTIEEIALQMEVMSKEKLEKILNPGAMV